MIVALLAAGLGKRLAPHTFEQPKCLLEIDGHTLLERHLAHCQRFGAKKMIIVTGHLAPMVESAANNCVHKPALEFRTNEHYERGSILSLELALTNVDDDLIFMDADVLYHPNILQRLFRTEHACALLLDASSKETGEEMMVGVQKGRAALIDRKISHRGPFELSGETLGFYRIAKNALDPLRQAIKQTVGAQGDKVEYEAALNAFFEKEAVFAERIDPLPWTEIDFAEDLTKAREHIAPNLPPLYT